MPSPAFAALATATRFDIGALSHWPLETSAAVFVSVEDEPPRRVATSAPG
jgi:hypothetical protein